jgi:hypothetical protein
LSILVQNRRAPGWNLIEVVFGVAIAATMVATSIIAYFAESQRAAVRKAEMFVSQIEMVKQTLRKSIDFGECEAPPDDSALAAQVLSEITVNGVNLTCNATTDAQTMGFADLSVGTLDSVDPNGDVRPGTSATVTLKNGVSVDRTTR